MVCSLLSGRQSCDPYHFCLNFLNFVKIPVCLFLHSISCCCSGGGLIPVQKWIKTLTAVSGFFWLLGTSFGL